MSGRVKNFEFRMGFLSENVLKQLKGLVKTKLISNHCFGTGQAGRVTNGRQNNALCDPQNTKSLLTMPSNVLPLRLKQTFLPIILIFTEREGDEIKSSLPFKIFSTL